MIALGEVTAACVQFEESAKLDPAPGTFLNLADCEDRGGKLSRAWQHLRRALDGLGPSDERVVFAQERLRSVERRLPRLTVRLAKPAPEAHVFRDGVELGPAAIGTPLPVDPGPHSVQIRAPFGVRSYDIVLAVGETKELMVEEPAASPSPPSALRKVDHAPIDSSSGRQSLGYVTLGIGALGVAAAGACVLASSAVRGGASPNDSQERTAARNDDVATLQSAGLVSLAAGGAVLAMGTALLLWPARKSPVAHARGWLSPNQVGVVARW